MKKIAPITLMLTLTFVLGLWANAQAQDELYVYRQGGVTDTLQLSEVTNIAHSRTDLQGRRNDDYVVMAVSLADGSVRQFPLEGVDSVVVQRDGERFRLVRFVGSMSTEDGGRGLSRALRRTSLDGDFTAVSADGVNFYWEDGDKIYIEADGGVLTSDSVVIHDGQAVADFYFKSGNITDDNVPVLYPGQSASVYNEVRVSNDQTQRVSGNTVHIGLSGDCGTAIASPLPQQGGVGGGSASYTFMLDHKASYLCFLPYIANDLGRTVLKQVTVRSDSAIAGVFSLSRENGIRPLRDTTHSITLHTGDFVLPRSANQYDCSAYMVIAPQNGSTRLTCEFTVYDTALQSTGIYTKTVDLDAVEPNMVYVVNANCNNYVVDLGLPVKFLNHNMAAFAPEEYGGYYAYGELNDKGWYGSNKSNNNHLYNNTPYAEIANIRLTDKDVAHMRLGGNFSIPTMAEMMMLSDSCTWSWQSSFNGTPGYKITGKNGNTLFMPAAGYRSTDKSELGSRGVYRTSQLIPSGEKKNWYLNFYSSSHTVTQSGDDIYLGESIRPVVSAEMQMTDGTLIMLTTDSAQWTPSQLPVTLYGAANGISKAKTPVELGFVVGSTADVTTAVAKATAKAPTTNADGKFSATLTMPKDTTYYYRAYAKDQDGNINYGNVLQFGYSYIDLGLPSGTKWATMNLGAHGPGEDGDHIAYGEFYPKASYTADNNKWYEDATWLYPDGLRDFHATRNDAATVRWGGLWMTPTDAEIDELISNCTRSDYILNGIRGHLLTSNINGNTIFVPKAAWRDDGIGYYMSKGWLASSVVRWDESDYAHCWNDHSKIEWKRWDGVTYRPVYKTNATSANGNPMYVRTLPARKHYDGTTETDTLRGIIRGLATAGDGNSYGFKYWKEGGSAETVLGLTPDADGYFSTVIGSSEDPLEPGATYHYAACVYNGTDTFCGDTLDVTAVGVVDLGLSVNWANVNIGAENEGAAGLCYRWGSTEPYRNNNSQQLKRDVNLIPDEGTDMVSNLWGTGYRLPTKDEYQELIDNTTFTKVTRNGVEGHLLTSIINGRSVFFPSQGYWHGTNHMHDGWNDYWTSTGNGYDKAYYYAFKTNNVGALYPNLENAKAYGFEVRGVQEKVAYLRTCDIGRDTKSVAETDTLIGFCHTTGAVGAQVGFVVGSTTDIVAGADGVTTYDAGPATNGHFRYVLTGLEKGRTYYYRAYLYDGTYHYGEAKAFQLFDYVDLGLPSGNLWANMNLGASVEKDYGDYYAWAETAPKDNYALETYKWQQNGSYVQFNHNIRGTEDDAATANLGHVWCMPTQAENQEMINNTDRDFVQEDGKNYWKFMNKSDHSKYIILPSAGRVDGSAKDLGDKGSGVYMSSSEYNAEQCNDFYLPTGGPQAGDGNHNYKYKGISVRAILRNDAVKAGTGIIYTDGCDLPFGATTATLTGGVSQLTSVPAAGTYGFVVGPLLKVDTDTPDAAYIHAVSNMDATGRFSYTYSGFDGEPVFFRAFLKVGDTYHLGELRSISYADLLDAVFLSDGSTVNGAATNLRETKAGTITTTYNSDYGRNQINLAGNTYGSMNSNTAPNRYMFDYSLENGFNARLADGHTVEAVLRLPVAPPNDGEAVALGNANEGGFTIGLRNKKFYAAFNVNSWRYVYSSMTAEKERYYHVVALYDKTASQLRLYVDGELSGTENVPGTYNDSKSSLCVIGGEPWNTWSWAYNGDVIIARVYDDVLTDTQIKTLFNNSLK